MSKSEVDKSKTLEPFIAFFLDELNKLINTRTKKFRMIAWKDKQSDKMGVVVYNDTNRDKWGDKEIETALNISTTYGRVEIIEARCNINSEREYKNQWNKDQIHGPFKVFDVWPYVNAKQAKVINRLLKNHVIPPEKTALTTTYILIMLMRAKYLVPSSKNRRHYLIRR